MTKQERVLAMLQGDKVDKLPKGEFYIEDGLICKLLELTPSPDRQIIDFETKIKAHELLGLDVLVFMADKKNLNDPWAELRQWQEESDFFLFSLLDGPFQSVSHSYEDFTDFLMDTIREKEKIQELVKQGAERSLELGKKAIEAGAHGLMIADDIAYNRGLYISPAMMREIFFPALAELICQLSQIAQESRGKELPFFFHSDGDIQLVLGDLKEMGFKGIHSLEPVMDLTKVREIVGQEICLMGGYSLSWFETGGVAKANELLAKILPGRYIFGSAAGILDSTLSPKALLEVYNYIDALEVDKLAHR